MDTLVLGVVASLVASAVFFAWMLLLRPRIGICQEISVRAVNDGRLEYRIKVVNRSRFRSIVDFQVFVFIESMRLGPDGETQIWKKTRQPLGFTEGLPLPRRKWRKDKECLNARQVRLRFDVAQKWPDNTDHRLTIVVVGKDSWSGQPATSRGVFGRRATCVKFGEYEPGNGLRVYDGVRFFGRGELWEREYVNAPAVETGPAIPDEPAVAADAQ